VLFPLFQFDGQQSETLIDVVVEFPRNPGTFLFVGLD